MTIAVPTESKKPILLHSFPSGRYGYSDNAPDEIRLMDDGKMTRTFYSKIEAVEFAAVHGISVYVPSYE